MILFLGYMIATLFLNPFWRRSDDRLQLLCLVFLFHLLLAGMVMTNNYSESDEFMMGVVLVIWQIIIVLVFIYYGLVFLKKTYLAWRHRKHNDVESEEVMIAEHDNDTAVKEVRSLMKHPAAAFKTTILPGTPQRVNTFAEVPVALSSADETEKESFKTNRLHVEHFPPPPMHASPFGLETIQDSPLKANSLPNNFPDEVSLSPGSPGHYENESSQHETPGTAAVATNNMDSPFHTGTVRQALDLPIQGVPSPGEDGDDNMDGAGKLIQMGTRVSMDAQAPAMFDESDDEKETKNEKEQDVLPLELASSEPIGEAAPSLAKKQEIGLAMHALAPDTMAFQEYYEC